MSNGPFDMKDGLRGFYQIYSVFQYVPYVINHTDLNLTVIETTVLSLFIEYFN